MVIDMHWNLSFVTDSNRLGEGLNDARPLVSQMTVVYATKARSNLGQFNDFLGVRVDCRYVFQAG